MIKISDIGIISATSDTQDASLDFTFNLVDADGDTTASQTLNVTIEGSSNFEGTASAESITGDGSANDLVGGAGNDILEGGSGADVFKWTLTDQGTTGTPAADVIKDFTVGIGGDVLNLHDLLQGGAGVPHDAVTLDGYLNFTELTSGKVVIAVDPDGIGSGGVTQTIALEGVTLA